jgi:hypothetical protein
MSSVFRQSEFTLEQRVLYLSMIPMWNTALLQSVSENFMMKEFPADKQFIIWWINLDQQDSL